MNKKVATLVLATVVKGVKWNDREDCPSGSNFVEPTAAIIKGKASPTPIDNTTHFVDAECKTACTKGMLF